ncbi:MAG: Nramp family divalent metal transporter [Actinomycetota bacterium]|nr:Nramp family divalent metal transporter [Actinomycetota bacterium]
MSEAPEQRSDRTGQATSALRRLGPGLLVTAAFIGPGTVTTASLAGADYGFALLWALVFSVASAVILQEMAARLGVVTREGLGQAMRTTFDSPVVKVLATVLVVGAITLGNTAFQTGNIIGAALGLEALVPAVGPSVWTVAVGVVAAVLLATGAYKVIERALIVLVAIMSLVFIVTAIISGPDLGRLAAGLVPSVPSGSLVTVIALIGTTIVPYNMFLHASSVQEKWPETVPPERALPESRFDAAASIGLGGLITLAIVSTAAAAFFGTGKSFEDAAGMAVQLEPLLGPVAKYFFATGLFAAGITSSVTAPLAAAYATAGVLGWGGGLRDNRFRAVWITVLVVGTVVPALLGTSPLQAILIAQAANGVLLPIIAVFLLVVMNRGDLLGEHRNGPVANVLGGIVVLVATGLGVFLVLSGLGYVG